MPTHKQWLSPAPIKCDLCDHPITGTFIDGKTRMGPWANMCPSCHRIHGSGLGMGRGQKYTRTPSSDGEHWIRTGG